MHLENSIIFIAISLGHTVLNLRIEYEWNQLLQTLFMHHIVLNICIVAATMTYEREIACCFGILI